MRAQHVWEEADCAHITERSSLGRQEPDHAGLSGLSWHFIPCIRSPSAFPMTSHFTISPNSSLFQHHWAKLQLCFGVSTGSGEVIESRKGSDNLKGLPKCLVDSCESPGVCLTRPAFANVASNLVITINDQDIQPPILLKWRFQMRIWKWGTRK